MSDKIILTVDDDENTRKMLSFLFVAKGFKVISAKDGIDAFEILKLTKPDVIILDIMMPGMGGFELCKRIKADNNLKEIPIIVLTALASSEDRERAFSLGVYDYLEKPFRPHDLVRKITEVLDIQETA